MTSSYLSRFHDLRLYAFVISIFISLWAIFIDSVINNDGILYLRAAELFGSGKWQEGLALYRWPLYSLIIAFFSKVTGLGLEAAAHALNAILYGLAVVWFIGIVRELGGDEKTQIAAALIILSSPAVNGYRAEIIRDAGYLSFYLLALLLLFKHIKQPSWKTLLGWTGSFFVAALFRSEGFVFLFAMPFVLWMANKTDRSARYRILAMMALVMFAGSAVLFALWQAGFSLMKLTATDVNASVVQLQNFWHSITDQMATRLTIIRDNLLPKYSRNYAPAVFILTMLLILVHSVISKLTPVFAVMIWHAYHRGLIFPLKRARFIWHWLILIGITVLIIVAAMLFFITGRWPMALSVTLSLAVPFSLIAIFNDWQKRRHLALRQNWVFPVVVLLLLVVAISGLDTFTNKQYIKRAGLWIKENTPAHSTLFSNDAKLIYYSGKHAYRSNYAWDYVTKLAEGQQLLKYDFVALNIKHKYPERVKHIQDYFQVPPIKVFKNKKDDKLMVFQLSRLSAHTQGRNKAREDD